MGASIDRRWATIHLSDATDLALCQEHLRRGTRGLYAIVEEALRDYLAAAP
jgi:hypothetical protein